VNPPKEIDDPEDVKPSDWVDTKRIPDPEAVKVNVIFWFVILPLLNLFFMCSPITGMKLSPMRS